jgi:hypothetical protein
LIIILAEDDNIDSSHGLQVCDEATGSYCCQRDYDCCQNSTLIVNLGHAEVVTTVVRPTSVAKRPASGKGSKNEFTKETVIGVGVGFSTAAVIFIIGAFACVYKRKRRLNRKAEKSIWDEARELDAVDTGLPKLTATHTECIDQPGDSANPIELDTMPTRSELDTLPSRSEWDHIVSPIATGSEVGTLVTPVRVELEAPFKTDGRPGER